MKKISKTKAIAAPKETVWSVLLEDEYNRRWMSEFSEGSHAETDWIVGHKVKFADASGGGIVGKVHEKKPYDVIHIIYDGIIGKGGEEDYDSAEAQVWKGAEEIYRLTGTDGETTLEIEVDTDDRWYDQMNASWDRALERIEELSLAL